MTAAITRLAMILALCLPVVLSSKHNLPQLTHDAQISYRHEAGAIIHSLRDTLDRAATRDVDQNLYFPPKPTLSGDAEQRAFIELFTKPLFFDEFEPLAPRARSPPGIMNL